MEHKHHAFKHMPCAKKNWDKISTPHNLTMVHPTSMCLPWPLPWTINILWNPHANVILKHKTMQQKNKNKCTTCCNAQSSSGASSTMKHDGLQFGICKRSFPCRALDHSTVFTYLSTRDNLSNWHSCVMKIKHHQCD
jgi:hypothetical protein